MGMQIELLKIAIRRRLSQAGIVDINKDFQDYGGRPLDPSGKKFWMTEKVSGDLDESQHSDIRLKDTPIYFQYDLFTPVGEGTFLLSQKEDAIRKEFDIRTDRSLLEEGGATGEVVKISSMDDINSLYSRRSIMLQIRVTSG